MLERGDGVLHAAVEVAHRHRVAQAAHADLLDRQRAMVGAGLHVGQQELFRGVHEGSSYLLVRFRSGRSGRWTKSSKSIGVTVCAVHDDLGLRLTWLEQPPEAPRRSPRIPYGQGVPRRGETNKLPACLESNFAFMAVSWTRVDDDCTIGQRFQEAVKSLSWTN